MKRMVRVNLSQAVARNSVSQEVTLYPARRSETQTTSLPPGDIILETQPIFLRRGPDQLPADSILQAPGEIAPNVCQDVRVILSPIYSQLRRIRATACHLNPLHESEAWSLLCSD